MTAKGSHQDAIVFKKNGFISNRDHRSLIHSLDWLRKGKGLVGVREGRPKKDQMALTLNLGDPAILLNHLESNKEKRAKLRGGRNIRFIMASTS